MAKAIRTFTIASDGERVAIKLFNEGGLYIWRIGGENGGPVELFGPSETVTAAMEDVAAAWNYPGSPWDPRAKWLEQ